jgi:DNA modification methylase
MDIRQSNTLNATEARSEKDERHVCPLQMDVIHRCCQLWSNEGEVVLSPFAGIGSEGVGSMRIGRKFVGIELKPEYFEVACKNLRAEEYEQSRPTLFNDESDDSEDPEELNISKHAEWGGGAVPVAKVQ